MTGTVVILKRGSEYELRASAPRQLPDGVLLAVLGKVFHPERSGGNHFDHWSISSEIYNHPELLEALAFLGVQRRKTGWNRGSLTVASDKRIAKWLHATEGRELGAVRLERDALGWYRIARDRGGLARLTQ